MKDTMGIIYTTKEDLELGELTASRAVAALPVIGRYRLIDFALSSLVNSGVRNVGVIMQRNYHSLMDHIGAGKEWDLNRRKEGLFILPPYLSHENKGSYEGTLEALRSNMGYLRRSKQKYVLLLGSYSVFNTNFDDMLRFHEENGADITIMYTKAYNSTRFSSSAERRHVHLNVGEDCVINDMEIGANIPSYPDMSMNVILIQRTRLMYLLDQAHAHGMKDMHRDLIQPYVQNKSLKVMGYEYRGYTRRIESIMGYYAFNMDMLQYNTRKAFFGTYPVYTKVRDEVPARYLEGAQAVNSLVADGCVIEGTVINSVLFRGVRVRRGAVVRNSVLMQSVDIQDGVEVENVILDKEVTVRQGRLIGQKNYPIVIAKGTTL